VAGSQKYLVLFIAAAIMASVVIMWIAFNPLDPLAIPPGETRGKISVCFSHVGAWAA
jgi:membrane associated rhomboid family serine protease